MRKVVLVLLLLGSFAGATPIQIPDYFVVPIIVENEHGNQIEDFNLHIGEVHPDFPGYGYDNNRVVHMWNYYYFTSPDDYHPIYTFSAESGNLKSGEIEIKHDYYRTRRDATDNDHYPFKLKFVLNEEGNIKPKIIITDLEIDYDNCLANCRADAPYFNPEGPYYPLELILEDASLVLILIAIIIGIVYFKTRKK